METQPNSGQQSEKPLQELAQDALLDSLEKKQRLERGTQAVMLADLQRGLDWEQSAVERETLANHAKLHGLTAEQIAAQPARPQGNMYLGDVIITQAQPEQKQAEPVQPVQPVQQVLSTIEEKKIGPSTAAKVAAVALALLGGGGVGAAAMNYLASKEPTEQVQPEYVDTTGRLELDR